MIHYRCPSGDWGCATGIAERAGQPCGLCAAKATWQALSAETRQVIDAAGFGLGAALSRLEGVLALPALFDRFPTLELVNAPSAQPKPHTLAVRW